MFAALLPWQWRYVNLHASLKTNHRDLAAYPLKICYNMLIVVQLKRPMNGPQFWHNFTSRNSRLAMVRTSVCKKQHLWAWFLVCWDICLKVALLLNGTLFSLLCISVSFTARYGFLGTESRSFWPKGRTCKSSWRNPGMVRPLLSNYRVVHFFFGLVMIGGPYSERISKKNFLSKRCQIFCSWFSNIQVQSARREAGWSSFAIAWDSSHFFTGMSMICKL